MRRFLATVAAVALGASMLVWLPAAQAAPAADTWEFSGSLSAPARSATNVTISVSGTVEVSQQILDRVPGSITCTSPNRPQVLPHLYRPSDGTYHAITDGGLALTPIDDTLPRVISGTLTNMLPSTYDLVLRFRCSDGSSWTGGIQATPPRAVTIASATTTSYLTLACLTSAISGACTADQVQYSKVPDGTSITFGAVARTLWSDGVTTNDPVSGTQSLTRAYTWSTFYSSIASTCSYATSITDDYKYRCEAGGVEYTPVTIETISPQSVYNVSAPTLTPSAAEVGSTVTVSGTVQERYSDGSFWPATTSTRYSVEFQATGTTRWETVVSSRNLSTAGSYSATFELTESGLVRTVVSSTTSASSTLTELKPSDTYQIGAPSLSGEVAPRTSVTTTASVKMLWSDGTYRNPPEGTQAKLQFATSFDPSASPASLTWRDVATAPAATGTASFTITPQRSGFWRVSVGTASGTPTYTRVTGSVPSTLTATMSPASGQKPFTGAVANYQIEATLTGYVGTEEVSLFASLGGDFSRVTTFDSSGKVSGTYPVRAGQTSGDVTPTLEARDSTGDVLAVTTTSPIYIDGIKEYQVTVVPPSQSVREGQTAKVIATASGISFDGVRYAVPWVGDVQVQRRTGSGWAVMSTKRDVRGERLTLDVTAIADAEYRIYWRRHQVASKTFTLKVLEPTGAVRFSSIDASPGRIERGDSSRISVRVLAEFSDRKFYAAPDGTKVTLQSFNGSSWSSVKSVFVEGGRISTSVSPNSTTTYRFAGSSGAASSTVTVTVTVVQATKLSVEWPRTYYYSRGGEVEVVIRTNTGSVWTGTTSLQFQYRFSTSEGWRTLDRKTYRGRKMDWGWGEGPVRTTYLRIIAPSLGLVNSKTYYPI